MTVRKTIAFLTFAVVQSACAGGAFTEPRLVPHPAEAKYELDKALELSDGLAVKIACPDASAAKWVEDHAKKWWKVGVKTASAGAPDASLGEEGYRLVTGSDGVTISAPALAGVRYALYTLRQMAEPKRGTPKLAGYECPYAEIRDMPKMKFRGIHVCCFPETRVEFIEHSIRQAAYYKMNHVVIEAWGDFRSEKFPWYGWKDGKLTKAEILRLRTIAAEVGVTLVPQVNIFGHATLASESIGRHAALDFAPEYQPLFEPDGGWNWCLSNPAARQMIADFVLEVHEAYGRPPYFHIGCDEARKPTCRECASGDYKQLVGEHIRAIAGLLRERGVTTLMWHDMLLEAGNPKWEGFVATGDAKADELLRSLPRDIVICDWYYGKTFEWGGISAPGDYPSLAHFAKLGFRTVTCPWEDDKGAEAQIKWSIAHGLFGALVTTWNRNAGHFRYREYKSADAMWGYPRGFDPFIFATHWRQTGWDMPITDPCDCGFSEKFHKLYY